MFSFLAADEGGVEVRVTAFNDLASKTAALITAGEVISLCALNLAFLKVLKNRSVTDLYCYEACCLGNVATINLQFSLDVLYN